MWHLHFFSHIVSHVLYKKSIGIELSVQRQYYFMKTLIIEQSNKWSTDTDEVTIIQDID